MKLQPELIVMKLLSKRQVKEIVLYSYAHIDRLEAQGLFPKRVRLGENRVGWLQSEVYGWLQAKLDKR
jgi:prophage regulatory protein